MGPIAPKPGPTLLNDEMEALEAVIKSIPVKTSRAVPMRKMNRNNTTNDKTEIFALSVTGFEFSFI